MVKIVKNKKLTNKEFKEKIYNLVGNEYIFLEDYINSSTKISCKHNLCGYVWKIKPNNFISNNNRCPKCNHVKSKIIKAKEKVYNILDNKYEIISDYKNRKSNMILKCNICNKEFEKSVESILKNNKNENLCPYCNLNITLSKKEYIKNNLKEIIECEDNDYEFIKEKNFNYINNKSKFKIKHLLCNNTFETNYSSFIYNKHRCPYCKTKKSKGELEIEKILIENNIEFIFNYKIKYNNYLKNKPFDFYIPKLNLLIEFNGSQHYEKKWYMTNEDLKIRKEIDFNKIKFAKKLNYNILVISYKDNIREKLIKEIESSTTIENK